MPHISVVPAFNKVHNVGDTVCWSLAPDLESEITTLAAFLQVKRQQREPLVSSDAADDADELDPRYTDDNKGIKEDFLDRLAELLRYDKCPALISSTGLILSDTEATIVAARNSTSAKQTWLPKDFEMLEDLAAVLEKVSADEVFESHPSPLLQRKLVEYYHSKILYHTRELVSIEKGETGSDFFKDGACGAVLSGKMDVHSFLKIVNDVSDSTDFYTCLKDKLTSKNLRRVVEELGFIERPIVGANAFLHTAQQCPGFRKVSIILLDSAPAREVQPWPLAGNDYQLSSKLSSKFLGEVKKRKNVHTEMALVAYFLQIKDLHGEVFPYLGISKKTCLLCGHVLQKLGLFGTRGNHGKCYGQWTLPQAVQVDLEGVGRLQQVAEYLRNMLWGECTKRNLSHLDAEKESVMAAWAPPKHKRTATVFNRVVEDPRVQARETEWLTMYRQRAKTFKKELDRSTDHETFTDACDGVDAQGGRTVNTEEVKKTPTGLSGCVVCKASLDVAYRCKKCENAAYCSARCCSADSYRHKFSCSLGRPIDSTDYLVLACHTDIFPVEDEVVNDYGFLSLSTGPDRSRLFELYRRLVLNWKIDEEELRDAVRLNKLKEMLTARCSQTRDPFMLTNVHWLKSQKDFRSQGQGLGIKHALDAARRDLLSAEDKAVSFNDLQPPQKGMALLFYVQNSHGFKPDVDEDNWIALGFCVAADSKAELEISHAYTILISRCTFHEFWTAMVECRMIELFAAHGLAGLIADLRNFENLMAIVSSKYQSVWELKRFTRTNVADPFRAVAVDYGFTNCEDTHDRMLLRETYRGYFEQGHDELELHEACVAGRLADFLREACGPVPLRASLLENPYPLKNYPLMGMVVESIRVCSQSSLNSGVDLGSGDGRELMVLPDEVDEGYLELLQERAAFLGTSVKRRISRGSNGRLTTAYMI